MSKITETIALADISARAEAATPGPWHVQECGTCAREGRVDASIWDREENIVIAHWGEGDPFTRPDAEFIAHARMDVSKLLDIIATQMRRLDRVRSFADCLALQNQSLPGCAVEAILRGCLNDLGETE